MKQIKWFDRKFDFSTQQNIFPGIIERLEGTPLRLLEKIKGVSAEKAVWKPDGKWSIAENIGHLSDLEPLWQARAHDILAGKKELTPTDLANTKTDLVNHNLKSLPQLIAEFTALRTETMSLLSGLQEEDVFRSALHPRLQTPMRILDLFIFTADHDDHHLAQITALKKEGFMS